jgi:drug/metabolite transporter (DMT)-like permease
VTAAFLALCASVSWGSGDFIGGFFSRRYAVAAVAVLTQAGAFGTAAVAALALGGVSRTGVEIGLLAGLCGGLGTLTYFRALSLGTMSVVAPIAACGAVVTVALALAGGEHPPPLRLAGALVAFSGAVLASFHERRRGGPSGRSITLAGATAVLFGALLYLLGRASDEGGAISAVVGSRLAAFTLLALWFAALRPQLPVRSPGVVGAVVVAGALGAAANGLYGLAAERGLLSIVSLLASLYPVTTVFLAYLVLHERLSAVQAVGVVVALAGVALVVVG